MILSMSSSRGCTTSRGEPKLGSTLLNRTLSDRMTQPSLKQLRDVYAECTFLRASPPDGGHAVGEVSDFWQHCLTEAKRNKLPSFNDMLVMRRGSTYPLADRAKVDDLEAEREYANSAWNVVAPSVPSDWWHSIHESACGAPTCFDFAGEPWTAGGIVNALTASRIADSCAEHNLDSRALTVLEIGAGYGQVAHQLFQRLGISSYADCDLGENLFLASYFLKATTRLWPTTTSAVSAAEPANAPELAFLSPEALSTAPETYDLVINSYSFQEMNLRSVEAYFELISSRLSDNGLFYSLNSHGKAGVAWPADYPVHLFELSSVRPVRRFPWQVFGTNPYELVMRRRTTAALAGDSLRMLRVGLDGLCCALQLGFHDELITLCESFSAGNHDDPALEALACYARSGEIEKKLLAAERVGVCNGMEAVGAHLIGLAEFSTGRGDGGAEALARANEGLAQSHARVRNHIALACIANSRGDNESAAADTTAATGLAPHLTDEILRLSADPQTFGAALADQLALTGSRADNHQMLPRRHPIESLRRLLPKQLKRSPERKSAS